MNKDFKQRNGVLYHYTTFESALKIIASQKLKFSKQSNLNDINEFYRPFSFPTVHGCESESKREKENREIENEFGKYRQISLCDDYPTKGFLIFPMWAHYAQKGRGVCLVLDKEKISTLVMERYHAQNVDYLEKYSGKLMIDHKDDIEKNIKEYFFHKTAAWGYEQEYRIVAKFEDDAEKFLKLNDAVLSIIIYTAEDICLDMSIFSSAKYQLLKQVSNHTPIYELGYFEGYNLRNIKGKQIWSENNFEGSMI